MPVKVSKRGDRFRVVEAATGRIARAKTKEGKLGRARDGGGTGTRTKANRIARAINASL